MRFAFSDDQLEFRDAVRALLAKECPAEVVRAAWPVDVDAGRGSRAEASAVKRVWSHLATMGVLGIAVPESSGGLGMSELDWVLLAEEAGYAAVPQPFVETVCVVAPLLADLGDPDGHLAGVIGGDTPATALLDESTTLLPHGRTADLGVLLVGGSLSLFTQDQWDGAAVASVDGSRGLARIDRTDLVGTDLTADPAVIARAYRRGVVGTSAQLLGLAQRMLDLTVAYVTERQQFGVPIGSFQAVKHHLADALMDLSLARPATYRAADSSVHDRPTAGRDASMAKAMASDAAVKVAAAALQCHGAIGYTVEYDLHLYLKRARALAATWGTAPHHRNLVGQAIGV